MSEVQDIAQEYHEAYCLASGLKVKYTMGLYSDWYLFAKEFDPEDLKTVIDYLRQLYRDRPDIAVAAVRLPKLIQDRTLFASYLAEAQACARVPKQTERQRLLDRTCTGTKQPEPEPKKASDVALKILKDFKKQQGWE